MDQLGEGKSGSEVERQLPEQGIWVAQNILRVEYFGLQRQSVGPDQVNKTSRRTSAHAPVRAVGARSRALRVYGFREYMAIVPGSFRGASGPSW